MSDNTVVHDGRNVSAKARRCEALDQGLIADLPEGLVNSMTCDELVRVIRAANVSHLECYYQRLPYYDCETLRRLAHLACRCCRTQTY